MNKHYLDFEGKTIFPIDIAQQHYLFDIEPSIVFWRNAWFNGEPIYSTNRFSLLQSGIKTLIDQTCDDLMISQVVLSPQKTVYVYDFFEDVHDWELQLFLLLLRDSSNIESFWNIKKSILQKQNIHPTSYLPDIYFWNDVIKTFCLPESLYISPSLQLPQKEIFQRNALIEWDIQYIQHQPLQKQHTKHLLYLYTLGFFDLTYQPLQKQIQKELEHRYKIMDPTDQIQQTKEILYKLGKKSIPLLSKTCLLSDQIDVISKAVQEVPIEVQESLFKGLIEDIDVNLDIIIQLEKTLYNKKNNTTAHLIQQRIAMVHQKLALHQQWDFFQTTNIPSQYKDIYDTARIDIIKNIQKEHKLLFKNRRYQPNNFLLDQNIYRFLQQNDIQNHPKIHTSKYVHLFEERLMTSIQDIFCSKSAHNITKTQCKELIEQEWNELQKLATAHHTKQTKIQNIKQKYDVLGMKTPNISTTNDIQDLDGQLKYIEEQMIFHQRIQSLHQELCSLGIENQNPPTPPYKSVQCIQLENTYKFQIARRKQLHDLCTQAHISPHMLPKQKLQEDDFLYWKEKLEQQIYWKEQFRQYEQNLPFAQQQELRFQWQDHVITSQQVSEILHQYQKMQQRNRHNKIFLLFFLIVICVFVSFIYIY